jgi:hypothetical protein
MQIEYTFEVNYPVYVIQGAIIVTRAKISDGYFNIDI